MMKACSGFLTDAGTSHIGSNELTTESKLSDKRFHQNHPLSHAMNRKKVSIEPRIVNGTNVNPPDKYSFMGALRTFEPLDVNHCTLYRSICFIVILFIYLMIDDFIFYDNWNRVWCNFDYTNYCSFSRYVCIHKIDILHLYLFGLRHEINFLRL